MRNAIVITSLMPQEVNLDRFLFVAYKKLKNISNLSVPNSLIDFIKKKYPDSFDLYSRNIYLLNNKSKNYYLSLITAGNLDSIDGVEIYLNSRVSKKSTVINNLIFYPFNLFFKQWFNYLIKADFDLQEINYYFGIEALISLYLLAGYDIFFGTLEGKTLINPYTVITDVFNTDEIKLLKSLDEISRMELYFNKNGAINKIWSNLEANIALLNSEGCTFNDRQVISLLNKMQKIHAFRSPIYQIIQDI